MKLSVIMTTYNRPDECGVAGIDASDNRVAR